MMKKMMQKMVAMILAVMMVFAATTGMAQTTPYPGESIPVVRVDMGDIPEYTLIAEAPRDPLAESTTGMRRRHSLQVGAMALMGKDRFMAISESTIPAMAWL